MFGKPECDVLQPEPHSGEACNTLSHKGLTNVNIQKGIIKLNETYLKVKFDFNSVGTNSLRIMGVNM